MNIKEAIELYLEDTSDSIPENAILESVVL